LQANFEQMFREFDRSCVFHYLRSFRRVRVDFETHVTAANAKLNLDGTPIADDIIHCYFIQVPILPNTSFPMWSQFFYTFVKINLTKIVQIFESISFSLFEKDP
jgi:hypothetical protein